MTMTIADVRAVRDDDGAVGSRADRPRRRSFAAEYKRRILGEYDRATEAGAKGALLRREGLYYSQIMEWRRARDAGQLAYLEPQPRTPKRSPEEDENVRLRAKVQRLETDLAKQKAAVEILGKAYELLELISEGSDTEPPSTP